MALVFRELAGDEYDDWDRFCDNQKTATVLHTTGWLGQRNEGELHILGCLDGGSLTGGFPYLLNRRLGLKRVVKPKITPYYGPVWKDDLDALTRGLVINGLIDRLRHYDVFAFSIHPGITLPDGTLPPPTKRKNIRTCLKHPGKPLNYSRVRRRQIRDGTLKGVRISETGDPEIIYRLSEMSIKRAGRSKLFEKQEFLRLYRAMKDRNRIVAFQAVHEELGVIGTQVQVYDNHRAYNILSGIIWEHKNLNAGPMLLAHSIEWALQHGLIFDFEGSSIKSVFEYFMRFNPEVVHYPYYVYVNSSRVKWLNSLARLLGRRVY